MNLTPHKVIYTATEEGLALETYLDSLGNKSWSMGLTRACGVAVENYINRPSSLAEALHAAVERMTHVFAPQVDHAFAGCTLTEAQAAAALSFAWNTGAILETQWVPLFKQGHIATARAFLETHYTNSGLLKERRMREAALFFDGKWPDSLHVPIWQVAHPSLRITGKPIVLDIMPALQQILGGA